MPSGGAREGAGRTRRSERYAGQIVQSEDRCRDRLPQTLDNIEKIADGRSVRVEVKCQPAGTITRKDVVRDKDGHPIQDGKGRFTPIEVLCYPQLDADEMVVIERKETHLPEDLQANQYLADRVLGKLLVADDSLPEDKLYPPAPITLEDLTDEDFEDLERIAQKLAHRPPGAITSGDPAATGTA